MDLRKHIDNNKGAALPIAIITIIVMTILGTVILSLGTNESNQVARNLRRTQAYYAARAGADAVAQYMINNPTQVQAVVAKTTPLNMAAGSLSAGTQFQVDVEGDIMNGLVITSTGSSDGVAATVVLEIQQVLPSDLFPGAIYTKGPLNVRQMTIRGNIASGGSITVPSPSQNFTGVAYPDIIYPYPSPTMPNDMDASLTDIIDHDPLSLLLRARDSYTISRSYYFEEIVTDSNSNLTFRLSPGENMHIQVDRFTGKGSLIVDLSDLPPGGDERLELYITDWAEFQTPIQVTSGSVGNPGDPNRLFIILKDGATLEIDANGAFWAYIYGPNADIALQSGNTTIFGAIVGNVLTRDFGWQSSQARVEYVPITSDNFPLPSVIALYRSVWRDVE